MKVNFDGKFTVTYETKDGEFSAFRVLPDAGHLFAAAPDLLCALVEAHDALVLAERNTMSAFLGEALRFAIDLSEKTIKKAKGEQ